MLDLNDRAIEQWASSQGIADPKDGGAASAQPTQRVLEKAIALGDALDRAVRRASKPGTVDRRLIVAIQTVVVRLDRYRRLRLLDWLRTDGHSAGLSSCAGSGESAAATFIRLEAFELDRQEILRRLFAPERIARLANACNAFGNEEYSA